MPSVEIAFDLLLAMAIVSVLVIRRRQRSTGEAEPVVVSVATGVTFGLVTVLIGILVISSAISNLGTFIR